MRPRAAHPERGLPGPRLQEWTEADHSDGQAAGHWKYTHCPCMQTMS